jgi:hypothetical protein
MEYHLTTIFRRNMNPIPDLGDLFQKLARYGRVNLSVSTATKNPFCLSSYDDKHRPFMEMGNDLSVVLARAMERAGVIEET